MSSTIAAPPTPTPSITDTPQPRQNSSSNLYLVTFLATLFLLLFVSCAIVLRSYILRRRYQRRLDEAMAAGMLLAPRAQGSKRKRFGAKPKVYDTWLSQGGHMWDNMQPLSAQPVFVKRKVKDQNQKQNGVVVDSESPTNTPRTRFWIPSVAAATEPTPSSLFPWRRATTTTAATTQPPANEQDPNTPAAAAASYRIRVEMLQVSVLIAMPCPSRSMRKNAALERQNKEMYHAGIEEDNSDDDDDEEPPLRDLAFGVTRVNYRQPPAGRVSPVLENQNLNLNLNVIPPGSPLLTSPVPTPVHTPGPEQQSHPLA